jgi:hypothetical protein
MLSRNVKEFKMPTFTGRVSSGASTPLNVINTNLTSITATNGYVDIIKPVKDANTTKPQPPSLLASTNSAPVNDFKIPLTTAQQ